MHTRINDLTGAEFPLFAFSHCRDVVAAVSRAGGFGVFGTSHFTPEQLDVELKWIDEHAGGKPYGVDLLLPENLATGRGNNVTRDDLAEQISPRHRSFAAELLRTHGIQADEESVVKAEAPEYLPAMSEALMDVALRHPIRLLASALGVAPPAMIERGKRHGVAVAALVGAKEHALRQVDAGVDILVVQGTEAGGHCGEVSTLVLVPEVIKAIKPVCDVPVLAAGGIVTGRQMAACMAMGAAGVWTGSVWLATAESETIPAFREKMIRASSRDTVRSRARTGKPARQLRSAWHDAWEGPESPGPLPMPLMSMLTIPSFAAIDKAAQGGNTQAIKLVSYFVGQGVGLIDSVKSAAAVVQEFKEDYADAVLAMQALLQE